jgi:hypothetical protein
MAPESEFWEAFVDDASNETYYHNRYVNVCLFPKFQNPNIGFANVGAGLLDLSREQVENSYDSLSDNASLTVSIHRSYKNP